MRRHADAQDCIEHNLANLNFLEDQLAAVKAKLEVRYREERELRAVIDESQFLVEIEPEMILGLGIRQGFFLSPSFQYNITVSTRVRCLNKHLLAVVLSYLDLNGGANLVCRYWSLLMIKNRKSLQSGAEVVYREKPTKRSIESALTQLKIAAETEYARNWQQKEKDDLEQQLFEQKFHIRRGGSPARQPSSAQTIQNGVEAGKKVPAPFASPSSAYNYSSPAPHSREVARSQLSDVGAVKGDYLTGTELREARGSHSKEELRGSEERGAPNSGGGLSAPRNHPRKVAKAATAARNGSHDIQISDDSDSDNENIENADIELTDMMGRQDKYVVGAELDNTAAPGSTRKKSSETGPPLQSQSSTTPMHQKTSSAFHEEPPPPPPASSSSLAVPGVLQHSSHSKSSASSVAPVTVSFDNILKARLPSDTTNLPVFYSPKLAQTLTEATPRVTQLTGIEKYALINH